MEKGTMSAQPEEHMTRAEFNRYEVGMNWRIGELDRRLTTIEGRAWTVYLAVGSSAFTIIMFLVERASP